MHISQPLRLRAFISKPAEVLDQKLTSVQLSGRTDQLATWWPLLLSSQVTRPCRWSHSVVLITPLRVPASDTPVPKPIVTLDRHQLVKKIEKWERERERERWILCIRTQTWSRIDVQNLPVMAFLSRSFF